MTEKLQQTRRRADIPVVVLTRPIIERLIVAVPLSVAWLHLEFAVPDDSGGASLVPMDGSILLAGVVVGLGMLLAVGMLIDALIGLARRREQAGLQLALSLAAFGTPAATWMAGTLAGA